MARDDVSAKTYISIHTFSTIFNYLFSEKKYVLLCKYLKVRLRIKFKLKISLEINLHTQL